MSTGKNSLQRCLPRALSLLLAVVASSCLFQNTQRWPPPMGGDFETLPPGDAATRLEGIEEVTVVRHADPVRVRPVGALSGQPLAFYDKRMRANAGSSVIVSPGGRAEVIWPSGTSVVVFGQAVVWVGSTGRGEPMLDFQEVDRARMDLHEGDRVRLMGGAELSGPSGPYVIERKLDRKLEVINQSKGELQVAFREELFTLGPGQRVVLPLLSASGAPIRPDPSAKLAAGPGFTLRISGPVEPLSAPAGLAFSAGGESRLEGLGQRVLLQKGESGGFSAFEKGAGASRPDAAPSGGSGNR